MLQLNNGYSGDGGIPGYLMLSLLPNDYTLPRVQAALAHECNHNVRFQFIKWNQQTTLADWVVSEGLVESLCLLSSMAKISLGLGLLQPVQSS